MKRILITGAALLLTTGVAFAQADDTGTGGGSGSGGDANGSGAPLPVASASAAGLFGGGPILDRALTLPKSEYGLYADFDIVRVSVSVAGMTASSTGEGLHLGGGYGVDDKLTIGAEYSFSLNSFEIKGPLALYGTYSLMHTDKLDIGGSADLVIDLNSTSVDMAGMVTSSTSETLQAGLGVRYKVAPKVAVYTGAPIAPGPLGQQLTIGFNSGAPISLDLPIGVAFQPTPQIYVWAQTNLAHIKISNTATEILFTDVIPLEIGGYYTVNKNLDVGAFLNMPDLKSNAFDVLQFGIAARWYK